MRTPSVELLWWAGCPSTERALSELREVLHELGLDDAPVRMREIATETDAVQTGFRGSPTILVDGRDVVSAPNEAVGLSCRIYHRRDGRISPTPDPEVLRAALEGVR
jgi:hypothetical protein